MKISKNLIFFQHHELKIAKVTDIGDVPDGSRRLYPVPIGYWGIFVEGIFDLRSVTDLRRFSAPDRLQKSNFKSRPTSFSPRKSRLWEEHNPENNGN